MNGYLKAIYGAVAAAIGSLSTALVTGDGHVTALGWVNVASAAILAFGAVYGVTNSPGAPGPDEAPKRDAQGRFK